ncbi:acylphosphatase [Microbacteriaceae bacterium K1510]|nr:acylphosphatase [Microbacteriaceae bacterium K1510]
MSHVYRHVVVRGRVQGVYFRAFVEEEALKLGVEGWVRNRRDGSVEALFVGAGEKVYAMIEVCRRGSPPSRVDALDEREGHADDLGLRRPGDLFSVLPSA